MNKTEPRKIGAFLYKAQSLSLNDFFERRNLSGGKRFVGFDLTRGTLKG